ncbi:hypothetical protein C8R46DRAFT_1361234 [Mycena filopes]|nr:hypothetical protein C8R46DRAFT_1361234 [Mycena filopes]
MPAASNTNTNKERERVLYSHELAAYTQRQFDAARKILDSRGHEEDAAKLPARHAARDGRLPPHQGQVNGRLREAVCA